jgi:hypothetical protein
MRLRQPSAKLHPRLDIELSKDLVEMVFHGTRTYEQPRRDFPVGEAIRGEAGDLGLLRRELIGRINAPFADTSTRGLQLNSSAFGETRDAEVAEHFVGDLQLLAGL